MLASATPFDTAQGRRHPSPVTGFWREIFGTERPVSVEIGPGKGEFLLATARADAARNFYAIERSRGRAERLAALAAGSGLANVRVIHADAACLLRFLPDASVAAYHILFPDPWWKRRHHRRRLFTLEFVATVCRTLAPGGTVEVISDVPATLALARACLDATPGLRLLADDDAPMLATAFARKAQQRGATVGRLVYGRRA
jgi:tRNA (guanine-N7-)-methyltransferase